MLRRTHHPLVGLLTALLFAVSLVGQSLVATAASAEMMASASSMEISSADNPIDCDGQDAAMLMTCVATCAGIIAIVADAAVLPVVPLLDRPLARPKESLSGRSIPPDPYPPRSSALS